MAVSSMPKRQMDTAMWEKPWFRKLEPVLKIAWIYLLHSCDYVGVWDADYDLADFKIGTKVDWPKLKTDCNDNIEVLANGKWWIVDYCSFQYGDVRAISKSSLQKAVHDKLVSHDLWDQYLARVGVPYGQGTGRVGGTLPPTLLSISKRNEVKEKEKKAYGENVLLSGQEYDRLVAEYGERSTKAAIRKLSAYKLQKGKEYKSDYGAILSWAMRSVLEKGGVPEPTKAAPLPNPFDLEHYEKTGQLKKKESK